MAKKAALSSQSFVDRGLGRLPDWVRETNVLNWLPQALLFCYYPLMYLESAVSKLSDEESLFTSAQRHLTIILFAICPLLYLFLTKYLLLDKEMLKLLKYRNLRSMRARNQTQQLQEEIDDKNNQAFAQNSNSAQTHPETYRPSASLPHMRSTDISTGLSGEEVRERQQTFGLNQIHHEASWASLIKRACWDPAYLLIFVRQILRQFAVC